MAPTACEGDTALTLAAQLDRVKMGTALALGDLRLRVEDYGRNWDSPLKTTGSLGWTEWDQPEVLKWCGWAVSACWYILVDKNMQFVLIQIT